MGFGSIEIFELLISANADVNSRDDRYGYNMAARTPLPHMFGAIHGYSVVLLFLKSLPPLLFLKGTKCVMVLWG